MSKSTEQDPRQAYIRRLADAWKDKPRDVDEREAEDVAAASAAVRQGDSTNRVRFTDAATIGSPVIFPAGLNLGEALAWYRRQRAHIGGAA